MTMPPPESNPRPTTPSARTSAEPVLLIIADISGYTRYMTANVKTLAHSQTIITELVEAIIRHIELPLEVAKLEGDAVFLFCRKQNHIADWPQTQRQIGEKLLAFFRLFSEKLGELSRSTTCTCNACTHIERLRLKVVVHSGEALFHQVYNFIELAGVDVILVHRLLKNSVNAEEYLLLTEAARNDLEFTEAIPLVSGWETYAGFGPIQTFVFTPGAAESSPLLAPPVAPSFSRRFQRAWKLHLKLWFAPFAAHPHTDRKHFHHLTASSGGGMRFALALLTLVLTPIMVPISPVFVLLHTLKPPTAKKYL